MMTEEDEEVLFDRAGLLSNKVKVSPELPKSRKACRLLRTFFLCAAFFGLGLCVAIPGPTLLDLQARTNTSTEQISRIFFGRSIGYLSGSILGGFLFDLINQNCLLAVTLLVTAVGTVAAPWSTNYLVLMGTFALQGITMGFLDTGGNVACLHIWGRSSGPPIQALHFSFGLGAFVAPLIAEPFLSRELNVTIFQNGLEDSELNPLVNPHARSVEMYLKTLKSENHIAESSSDEPLKSSGIVGTLKRLFRRDVADAHDNSADGGKGDSASNNASSSVPRPTKPKSTNAEPLSKDTKSADGSNLGKVIAKLKHENVSPVPKTVDNPCSNYTESNGTQICLDEPTTTTTTVSSSTVTTTPTTTTTPSTTTSTTQTTTTTTVKTTVKTTAKTTAKTTVKTTPSSTKLLEKSLLSTGVEDAVTTAATKNQTGNSTLTTIMNEVAHVFANLHSMTKVEFAYITIAAFLFLLSVLYAFVCCCDGPCTLRSTFVTQEDQDSKYVIHRESRGFRVQILILLFVFYFLYVGMEVTYGGLIMTFTVRHLGWDKRKGTLITSVFWGAFAMGRGLAIFIAQCLSPVIMLVANLVITILSLGGLVMVLESNEQMLWFCTATLGIGMASIFPTGITWAERYMQVTGKAAAVFVVGSALGEMAMPVLTGYLFDKKGPMCLMYVMLAAAIVSSIIYIIMQNLASNKGERYQRLNTLMKMAQSGDEEDEIESNVDHFTNHTDQQDSDSPEHHSSSDPLQNGVNRKRVTFQLPEENGVHLKKGNRRNLKRTFLGRKNGKQI